MLVRLVTTYSHSVPSHNRVWNIFRYQNIQNNTIYVLKLCHQHRFLSEEFADVLHNYVLNISEQAYYANTHGTAMNVAKSAML